MSDLLVAFGLVLVIEGVLWAVLPRTALGMLQAAATTPEPMLRVAGAIAVAVGVSLVWLVRG